MIKWFITSLLFVNKFLKEYTKPKIMIMKKKYDSKNYNIYSLLSLREIEILKLILEGNTSKQISYKLSLSFHTIISHRKNIFHKTKCKSISELFSFSLKNGMFLNQNIPHIYHKHVIDLDKNG
jgi:DNA-binding CsgD family transcriptional regulator